MTASLLPIPTDDHTRHLYEAWPQFQEAWGRKARKRWAESLEYILAERYPAAPDFLVWKTAQTEAGKLT